MVFIFRWWLWNIGILLWKTRSISEADTSGWTFYASDIRRMSISYTKWFSVNFESIRNFFFLCIVLWVTTLVAANVSVRGDVFRLLEKWSESTKSDINFPPLRRHLAFSFSAIFRATNTRLHRNVCLILSDCKENQCFFFNNTTSCFV